MANTPPAAKANHPKSTIRQNGEEDLVRNNVSKSIAAAALGLSVTACAIGLSGPVSDALNRTAARSPKAVSGSLLDSCVKGYEQYNNISYPEGRTATFSQGSAAAIVRYFPNDPADISKTGNLVSYQANILIRDNRGVATSYIHCYYENVGGKLRYLTSMLANSDNEVPANYKYNNVEDIYSRLTGKKIRIH